MSEDARLKILIQYIRDESQAKAALADMDALQQAGKKAGEGVLEAGEGVKAFNTHGREMHRLINEMDRTLPGTGLLLRAVFNPEALGIAAVVLAVELIVKAFEKQKKALEELAGEWIAQRDAIDAAKASADEFTAGLARAKDATSELKEEFAKEQSVLDAQVQGHKKLIEVLEQEELAQAGGDSDKEEKIKRRFENLKREYDLTAELLKVHQEDENLGKLKGAQGGLAGAAASAEQAKDAALRNQGAAELKARVDSQDEKKLKVAYDAAIARINQSASGPTVEAARAEAEAMRGEDSDVQAFLAYENDRKALVAHEATLKKLIAAAEKAAAARDENQKAIDAQTKQIDADNAIAAEHQKTAKAESAIKDVSNIGGAPAIGGLVESVANNMQALEHGHKLSASQLEANRALTRLMSDLGYSNQAIVNILNSVADNQSAHARLIGDLERKFGTLLRVIESKGK
jgi:hypothetical protein